ncbi:MAG TPA: hypothetical protein PLO16_12715 [Acidocella sp.]|nr:hypothetical protein [Acidocella sp.]
MNAEQRRLRSVENLRRWRDDPRIFVREVFNATPDPWQDDILAVFPYKPRVAMSAAKGPGKSTLLAWMAWNFLATRPHPKIAATSITADTLADTLWAEMAKWQNRSTFLSEHFVWQKTRIFAKANPETWFMSARSWSKTADAVQQGNTLAGLHADFILFLLDEAGGIPDAVMAAAEAALSSCVEGHLIIAGNPTHLSGPLYRAATSERRLWHFVHITGDPADPKRSPRISVEWAKEQIEKYGRENPWVKVNVFGEFPPASLNSLIGPDEVRAAIGRYYRGYEIGNAPLILGVDVARQGDDSSVVAARRGIQMLPMKSYRGLTSTQGAGVVSRIWADEDADACFIDMTGGYGAGWYDQLNQLGKAPIGVQFSQAAHKADRYVNKRAEMAFEFVEWIKNGGALPDIPELTAALTNTCYTFQKDRLLIEPKDVVKAKIGYSPDHFDAGMLTFAEPVAARRAPTAVGRHQAEYDPFASLNAPPPSRNSRYQFDYLPYGD